MPIVKGSRVVHALTDPDKLYDFYASAGFKSTGSWGWCT